MIPACKISNSPARRHARRIVAAFLCCFPLLAAFGSAAASSDPSAAFDAANRLYEQGKFTEAAAAYQHMIESGAASAAVWFNRGNALFKSGQAGRALACYLKADELAPRDPDAAANLIFVRSQVQGPTLTPGRWERWLGGLTLDEWTVLLSGTFSLWLLLLAARRFWPRLAAALRLPILFCAGATVLLCICLAGARRVRAEAPAIVVENRVTVRNGPFEESPAVFTVHDGAEVKVVDTKSDWVQISAGGRQVGWVKSSALIRP
jgi:tetratricopeptide (TPR) repeat protein